MAAGNGKRDLRVRSKQVDYSDFYTPEDAKKQRKTVGADGDDYSDDDDDDDDVVLPLKLSKTATSAAAQSKSKDKEKEPVKKKKSAAFSSSTTTTTHLNQGEAKKNKKRAHAVGEDDDFDGADDEVVEKKKKAVKKAKMSESEGKEKQGERKQSTVAAPVTAVVKRKKKEQADPKEKPAKDKERKRGNDATINGTANPVAKKVLSLSKPVVASSKSSSESSDLSDVTALRKKYEALKQIHETEGGRLLEDAKALALEEKKTYERLISKLKKEVSTLATRLQDEQIKREKEIEKLKTENQLRLENLERKYADSNDDSHGHRKRIKELEVQLNEARRHTKANGKAAASRSGSKAVEDNLQLAQATKLLEIYRLVTSTEIRLIETLEDDDDASYTDVSCATVDSNTGKQFHFDLGVPADEDEEIEYLPSETPNKDFKIPSYLQDELSFKRSEITKFMRTIMDVVIRKKTQAASSDARSNR